MSVASQDLKDLIELDIDKFKETRERVLKGEIHGYLSEPATLKDYRYYFDILAQGLFTEALNLSRNKLANFDLPLLKIVFSPLDNKKITSLVLQRIDLCSFLDKHMQFFTRTILNSNVIDLNLSRNSLHPNKINIGPLFAAIANSTVRKLNLSSCDMYDFNETKVRLIFEPLIKSKLEELTINEIPTDESSAKIMFECIAESNIHTLKMGSWCLSKKSFSHIKPLFDSIARSKIKNLSISSLVDLSDESIEYIFKTICDNPEIEFLDLEDVDFSIIKPIVIEKIFDYISNSSITSLSLKACKFNGIPIDTFVEIFKKIEKSNIESLNLQETSIFYVDAISLREIYESISKSKITSLNLAGNGAKKTQDLIYLLNLIKREKQVTSLDIGCNGIPNLPRPLQESMFKAISESGMTSLNVGNNCFEMVEDPTTMLENLQNSSISELYFHASHFGSYKKAQVEAFFKHLAECKSIKIVHFEDNHLHSLTPDAKEAFLKGIEDCQLLKVVHNVSIFEDPILAKALDDFNAKQLVKYNQRRNWGKIGVANAFFAAKPNPEIATSIFALLDTINDMAIGNYEQLANSQAFNLQKFSLTPLFRSLTDKSVSTKMEYSAVSASAKLCLPRTTKTALTA